MRLSSLIPALLSLALLGASGHVLASDSRTMDGGAGCPENANASNTRADEGEAESGSAAGPVRRAIKAGTPRDSGVSRSTAPRWHSFLPGMFR